MAIINENPTSNIHQKHNTQDSTITVATNTNSRYVMKKFATAFRIKRSGKYLSVFLFRSFQEISCLNKVIIFSEKRNYCVNFILTVNLADGSFNASREFMRKAVAINLFFRKSIH